MTTLWDRVKTGSKSGFDKTWQALDKVGAPVNRLSNKLGSEAFWPTTLDKESDKAARILKSFCTDGFYAEEDYQPTDGPRRAQTILKKIPSSVIKNAKGLAIFTTMRTGLWFSGAGGSGVLIARKDDGSWSPPSGILLHTAGLGFMIGIDIYDCVVVINTTEALEAFYKVRCTLGSEISVAAGPVGAGGVLDTELHKRQAPIFTYMKSRGFYAGVQIDGTILIERGDENERFYGYRVPVKDILSGRVRHPPYEIRRLMETLKAAQGDSFDASALPTGPPPSDYELNGKQVFGVPDKEDPDPYGVLAMEKAGMTVKEAGSQKRASWDQFSFNPSPTSPVHTYARNSTSSSDLSFSRRNSWRSSYNSTRPSSTQSSPLKVTTMQDTSTQTDSPILTWDNGLERHGSRASTAPSYRRMRDVTEELTPTTHDKTPLSAMAYSTPPSTPPSERADSPRPVKGPELPPRQLSDPVREVDQGSTPEQVPKHVEEVVQVTNPVVARARLIDVPKRTPPKLPPRNPDRNVEAITAAPTISSHEISEKQNPTSTILTEERTLSVLDETSRPVEFLMHDGSVVAIDKRESRGSDSSSTCDKIRALRGEDDE